MLSKKVLVVDDDPVFKLIARKLFEKSETELTGFFAENGLEGINFLKNALDKNDLSSTPDIILLDIEMPLMNGWDFMDEFIKLPEEKTKDIHVYTVSSSIAQEDKKRTESYSQIKDYIPKPLTINILQKITEAHQH